MVLLEAALFGTSVLAGTGLAQPGSGLQEVSQSYSIVEEADEQDIEGNSFNSSHQRLNIKNGPGSH
jgi:hypothetical protein